MERLTRRICGGWGVTPGYELNTVRGMKAVVDRLAAYENTGLEPGEVVAMKIVLLGRELAKITDVDGVSINRICELAQAEKDGRLVVLPPNDPLTLDELREMDGEPVWIIPMRGSGGFRTWMLVDAEYELCREAHGEMAVFENCGKTWLAYRRRPEEAWAELERRIGEL